MQAKQDGGLTVSPAGDDSARTPSAQVVDDVLQLALAAEEHGRRYRAYGDKRRKACRLTKNQTAQLILWVSRLHDLDQGDRISQDDIDRPRIHPAPQVLLLFYGQPLAPRHQQEHLIGAAHLVLTEAVQPLDVVAVDLTDPLEYQRDPVYGISQRYGRR